MRLLVLLSGGLLCLACEERPAPPVVVPKPVEPPPAVDAGLPPAPPEPDNVLQLPTIEAAADATEGEGLMQLLLDDPARAEQALLRLPTPDAWQVALIAQFALRRGAAAPDALPETPLPELPAQDAGVLSEGDTAYVARASLPLYAVTGKGRGPTLVLPINTPVHVDALAGAKAHVSVQVASEVDYDEAHPEPVKVTSKSVVGSVDASWLAAQPTSGATLLELAAAQPDSDEGNDRAVVLAHRALLAERSEAARAALLRAAWKAQRASWVVTAAMARNLAPVSRLTVAYTCVGDPATAKWRALGSPPPRPRRRTCA